jgi:hypothetical protein
MVTEIFSSSSCHIPQPLFIRRRFVRRRFVPETLCYRRRSVTETFCYGDVLYGDVSSRRRYVWRRFVCAPIFQCCGAAAVADTVHFRCDRIRMDLTTKENRSRIIYSRIRLQIQFWCGSGSDPTARQAKLVKTILYWTVSLNCVCSVIVLKSIHHCIKSKSYQLFLDGSCESIEVDRQRGFLKW